jgi:hypothetical protein
MEKPSLIGWSIMWVDLCLETAQYMANCIDWRDAFAVIGLWCYQPVLVTNHDGLATSKMSEPYPFYHQRTNKIRSASGIEAQATMHCYQSQ